MIRRQLLAVTAPLIGVCLAVAHTAFALGNTCSNVDITLANTTAVKIKVTKFEYYDYTDNKWRTESMFGLDGHQKLEPGASWAITQDLEHVENDQTKFKVTYEADIDGTKPGEPVSKTTSEFTCKDEMNKAVLLDVAPPAGEAKDCTWTVAGTVKVQTQEPILRSKFGVQIPLEGIKVKVAGATVGSIFDSWGETTTDANGKFSLSKQKSCEDRKLKVQVQFQNSSVEIRDDKYAGVLVNVPWFTIVEDSEKRRKPGLTQIAPTVFTTGQMNDLGDFVARRHADIWVIANTLRDHLASYGAQFKYMHQSIIKYPNNEAIAPDSKEASFTHPVSRVVNIFRSNDGTNDHMTPGWGLPTLAHEMMHAWVFEHVHGELDMAFNLITSFDTHCFNDEQHVSFHEASAEVTMELLMEEIFGITPPLPFNRDALKEGLLCNGNIDKINTMALMEKHEFGWMSLFRMLTTDQLSQFTYAGEASSTSPSDPSVFISRATSVVLGCSNPTNHTLKDILNVFLSHPSQGFSNNLTKSEMKDMHTYIHRAAKILGFTDQETALKNLLDPTKPSEPKDELCGLTKTSILPGSIIRP